MSAVQAFGWWLLDPIVLTVVASLILLALLAFIAVLPLRDGLPAEPDGWLPGELDRDLAEYQARHPKTQEHPDAHS